MIDTSPSAPFSYISADYKQLHQSLPYPPPPLILLHTLSPSFCTNDYHFIFITYPVSRPLHYHPPPPPINSLLHPVSHLSTHEDHHTNLSNRVNSMILYTLFFSYTNITAIPVGWCII